MDVSHSDLLYIFNSTLGDVGSQGINVTNITKLLLMDSDLSHLEARSVMVDEAAEVIIVNNLFLSDPLGKRHHKVPQRLKTSCRKIFDLSQNFFLLADYLILAYPLYANDIISSLNTSAVVPTGRNFSHNTQQGLLNILCAEKICV
jgi:hypothetical protein